MKFFKFLVLSIGLVLSLSMFSNSASASGVETKVSTDNRMSAYSSLWYLTFNQGYQSKAYGSWKNGTSGSGPASLTLAKSVTVANTYSGTLSASKKDVSASVGFNITSSKSTTASYTVKVPKGKKYMIQWRPVYKKYKVKQDAYIGSTFMETTYVYPKKYDYLDYRWIVM
ncbi:hypothetical protein [Peribacillus simplex]|uniref:Uncharacterized protein n=1 Tax=Peribacillus simplex TaxID=1478 RepID=A0A9W4KNU3_9BACI|nr:hypothetical protein [Peribacillus simplex]MDR4928184.1 hypothetical protein [Peribacillus simplex]CAH0134003.1 hypothetical protein SRABI133_00305 [Peribacillus simplex]